MSSGRYEEMQSDYKAISENVKENADTSTEIGLSKKETEGLQKITDILSEPDLDLRHCRQAVELTYSHSLGKEAFARLWSDEDRLGNIKKFLAEDLLTLGDTKSENYYRGGTTDNRYSNGGRYIAGFFVSYPGEENFMELGEIIKGLNIPGSVFADERVQAALAEVTASLSKTDSIEVLDKLFEFVPLPPEVPPDLSSDARSCLYNYLRYRSSLDIDIYGFCKKFQISYEDLLQTAAEAMESRFVLDPIGTCDALGALERLVDFGPDLYTDEFELKEVVGRNLNELMAEGYSSYANWVAGKFNIPKEVEISNYPKGATLNKLVDLGNKAMIGSYLVGSLNSLTELSYEDQVLPIVAAQGDAAFLYFYELRNLYGSRGDIGPEDLQYLVHLAKKFGTSARNVLANVIPQLPGSIAAEGPNVDRFMDDIGVADFDLYTAYKEALSKGDYSQIESVKEKVRVLTDEIYEGKVTASDCEDPLYHAVSFKVFPPAFGITKREYANLLVARPDRSGDIPSTLEDIQYEARGIKTGRYVLEEGEVLDLSVWQRLSGIFARVNSEDQALGSQNLAEIGRRLARLFNENRLGEQDQSFEVIEALYRNYVKQGGQHLAAQLPITREGLSQYEEFVGGQLKNNLVLDAINAYAMAEPNDYATFKDHVLDRAKQSQNQTFSKVVSMLKGIKRQGSDAEKAGSIKKLNATLTPYGLTHESVTNMQQSDLARILEVVNVDYQGELDDTNYQSEEYYNSQEFIEAYDEFVNRYDANHIVARKVAADITTKPLAAMKVELSKFKFSSSVEMEKVGVDFVISKRKEHGVVGYNMGVCVTPDEALWNDSTFSNVIMFDSKTHDALGGMHLLVREGALILPGINPSIDLIGKVDVADLYDNMIAYAKEIRDSLALDKLLIPADPSIHSNRAQIQSVIRNQGYKVYKMRQNQQFSYDPYKYSFQDCFEVT